MTEVCNISRLRDEMRLDGLVGRKRFPWNSSAPFLENSWVMLCFQRPWCPSGGYADSKSRTEWTVIAVFVCGFTKHTQSSIKLGKHENNFQFLLSFHLSGSAMGPKLRRRGEANSSEDEWKAQMEEEEYWSWTGSHVTSHRKPASLPWNLLKTARTSVLF